LSFHLARAEWYIPCLLGYQSPTDPGPCLFIGSCSNLHLVNLLAWPILRFTFKSSSVLAQGEPRVWSKCYIYIYIFTASFRHLILWTTNCRDDAIIA
jgi:hypothetical protein